MIREVNTARDYLNKKFNGTVKAGTYAVPIETSKGQAFMKVVINEEGSMSDFHLFKDEKLATKQE